MNMANFQQSTWNIPNWDFDGVLSSKIENAWTQNLQLSVMTMKNNAKIEEELTCCFKTDIEIWRILTRAPKTLKNLHFNALLLNKMYNAWAKKVQRSYVSWH